MSGPLHFELDRSDLRSGGIRRRGGDGRLGGLVISAAVDSFSSRIDCYQRHEDTSSPFMGDDKQEASRADRDCHP